MTDLPVSNGRRVLRRCETKAEYHSPHELRVSAHKFDEAARRIIQRLIGARGSGEISYDTTPVQLLGLHTHLFDHLFLFRSPCAGHVSVLHEQFLLGIHFFCRVELFHIGLMP